MTDDATGVLLGDMEAPALFRRRRGDLGPDYGSTELPMVVSDSAEVAAWIPGNHHPFRPDNRRHGGGPRGSELGRPWRRADLWRHPGRDCGLFLGDGAVGRPASGEGAEIAAGSAGERVGLVE